MPTLSTDARFLGLDLQELPSAVRATWRRMGRWPVLRWLTPDVPVRLLQADGGTSVWQADHPRADSGQALPFVALEIPEDDVLRRTLSLPEMSEGDLLSAMQLEAQSASPFPEADTALGYRAHAAQNGVARIDLVLASRAAISRYLENQATRWQDARAVEVWAWGGQGLPIALHGYGDGARLAFAGRGRAWALGLLGLLGALLLGMALAPTAQLRLRALEAAAQFASARERTAPLVQKRATLVQATEQLQTLSDILGARIEPLRVLKMLTEVLPDDTYLLGMRLQGSKLTLTGMTANASALMQILGAQPGLRDVRAPAAAVRMAGTNKENFTVELVLDAQLFGVVSGPPIDPASVPPAPTTTSVATAPPAAVPAPPIATAASAPAPAPAPLSPPAPPAPAVASPTPAAGAAPAAPPAAGGAVFGGTRTKVAPPAPAASPASAP